MALAEKGGIRIPILTYYSDKGVKAASKSLASLETTANRLAKTFGVTLAASTAVAFGKKSLDAFAKDQKAAAQLTATLYNLGLAYQGIGVNQFISDLQDATGVMDDQLRPALQSLVTYTLDYAKAQKLLSSSLDISSATGNDLQTVAEALGNAYNGNYKGLVGLKIGITQAEAKAESFTQIMQQLNEQFKGAATLDTYQLRLQKIKVAAADATEYIGQGIAGALATLTSDGNIERTMTNLRNFGKVISEEIIGFASGIKQLFKDISQIPLVKLILGVVGGAIKGLDKLLGISKAAKADIANFDKKMAADQAKADAKAIAAAKQQAALNKKLQAQQLADQKKLTAEKTKQAALDKAALALKQAENVFNLDRIEVAAALQNKQTAEDMARLKIKQDIFALEDAIDAKNATLATSLANVLDADAKRLKALQDQKTVLDQIVASYKLLENKEVKITFTSNGMPSLTTPSGGASSRATVTIPDVVAGDSTTKDAVTTVTDSVTKVADAVTTVTDSVTKVADAVTTVVQEVVTKQSTDLLALSDTSAKILDGLDETFFGLTDYAGSNPNASLNGASWVAGLMDNGTAAGAQNAYLNPPTITIVDNTSGLIDVITDATQQASANGINTRLVRNTGGLNW